MSQQSVSGVSTLSLSQLIINSIRRHGDAVALHYKGIKFSYRDLDSFSDAIAAALSREGIQAGDCVAFLMRNCPEYVVADLAILKLGAVKVPLNELMSSTEAEYCIQHSGSKAIIGHGSLLKLLSLKGLAVSITVLDTDEMLPDTLLWARIIGEQQPVAAARFDAQIANSESTSTIMYTGGTTGRPKGVRHLQGRMAVNILAHITSAEIKPRDKMLLTTPLPHSAGLFLQAGFVQGCEIYLEPRFNAERFHQICSESRIDWAFMVPTMLYRLLDLVEAKKSKLSLQTIVYGAAPINRERLDQALSVFGPIFIQLYGQTECPNFITTLRKDEHLDQTALASCGSPVPYVNVRIKTEQNLAAPLTVGELQVSGSYLMADYYNDKELTTAAFDGRWLKTGDLGYADKKGRLFLVDRAKDMIISGGMNVYSIEVETSLRNFTGVQDVAVVGIPDPDWGEAVAAVIIASTSIKIEELRAYCKAQLASYKVPKQFIFQNELPLTRYGKVDKKAIKRMIQGNT